MTSFQTRSAPLETLEQRLPALLQNLSLARAQIVIDHLRGVIQTGALGRIVFMDVSPCDAPESPVAAAIAIQQPLGDDESDPAGDPSDAATILHAGLLEPRGVDETDEIMTTLWDALEKELDRRGIGFAQWATDPADSRDASIGKWCGAFGFVEVGTLQYLGGPVENAPAGGARVNVSFEPAAIGTADQFRRFSETVAETYEHTLDCPKLADYRTAMQTLRGYQASDAFDPRLWFSVNCEEISSDPIGCLILARHADATDKPPVIEIVYMGLVPDARGNRLGRVLVQHALDQARSCGAERMILAVDQENRPAREIYQSFGLESMLRETVWVRSIGSND